jgi:hypothetical protein
MQLSRVLHALIVTMAVAAMAPGMAYAEGCDYPATGKPVAYQAPPPGTTIKFEDVALRADREQVRRELEFTVRTTSGAETEWDIRMASGQAVAVRTFLGLIQTANSSGAGSDFERERYAALWPLDAGKSAEFTMSTATENGGLVSSSVSMCVRRFETLRLSAGDFETVVIDSHRRITGGGEELPMDEIISRYWYVPELGVYLQRVRALFAEGREVMKQTRRALTVSTGR